MKEDLWPDIIDDKLQDNNSIRIIKEQSKFLENKTEGLVKASFKKSKYVTALEGALKKYGEISKKLIGETVEKEEDEELLNKEDFNDRFIDKEYNFTIYNANYKFRVFSLLYREEYPIYLLADAGINEELKIEYKYTISTDEDLKELLKRILGSNKVKIIVSRMYNTDLNAIYDRILEYLKENSDSSLGDISEKLSMPKNKTSLFLERLEKENKVIRIKEKNLVLWKAKNE